MLLTLILIPLNGKNTQPNIIIQKAKNIEQSILFEPFYEKKTAEKCRFYKKCQRI